MLMPILDNLQQALLAANVPEDVARRLVTDIRRDIRVVQTLLAVIVLAFMVVLAHMLAMVMP